MQIPLYIQHQLCDITYFILNTKCLHIVLITKGKWLSYLL